MSDLGIGKTAYVKAIEASSYKTKRRLIDMGLIPGTEVRMIRIAPFGDPIMIELRGYSVFLKKSDAALISIVNKDEFLARNQNSHRAHETMACINSSNLDFDELNGMFDVCATEIHSYEKRNHNIHISKSAIRLALIGNPNCGKTTLFNNLTGEKEYIGNWPGVTVDKKEGKIKKELFSEIECINNCVNCTIIDLPGVYSLSPYSLEEVIARDYIIYEKPNVLINVIDITNLERSLYLTVQLMELGVPMILALNKADRMDKAKYHIDLERLYEITGIPMVPVSAKTGHGLDKLMETVFNLGLSVTKENLKKGAAISIYDKSAQIQLCKIAERIKTYAIAARLPVVWSAIKLLEDDETVRDKLHLPESVVNSIDNMVVQYADSSGRNDRVSAVANLRYAFIERILAETCSIQVHGDKKNLNEAIDDVLTNKYLAFPVLILIIVTIFILTFSTVGAALSDYLTLLIEETLIHTVQKHIGFAGIGDWTINLICDGVIKSVGSVLAFLPQIFILFLCISALEESGYMSRIAFIMDKHMRILGLSGKSCIALLMGFGCTATAAMAARATDSQRDKQMTILLLPFISCSAKLPVYSLIAGTFFNESKGLVVISLYILGILFGVFSGVLLKKHFLCEEESTLIMELPPYSMPALKNMLNHAWERTSHFLKKAGRIILAMSIILWFLSHLDLTLKMTDDMSNSIISHIGRIIAPVFVPLGFGTWEASVALLTGIVAKEGIVSSLAMLSSMNIKHVGNIAKTASFGLFNARSAYSFLVFVMMYTPCMAALTVIYRELQSKRYFCFAVIWQFIAAWLVSFATYGLTGMFCGEGNNIVIILSAAVLMYSGYFIFNRKCCNYDCNRCQKDKGCSQNSNVN